MAAPTHGSSATREGIVPRKTVHQRRVTNGKEVVLQPNGHGGSIQSLPFSLSRPSPETRMHGPP